MFLNLKKVLLGLSVALAADKPPVTVTKLCGDDEQYCADVDLIGGVRRLKTDSVVTVEQVFGSDPQGSTWGAFGATLEDASGIGSAGDTVRTQIPAAVTPIGTLYPAVDVTYTIVAGDVSSSNPERTVALNVCSQLNADANFIAAKWKCEVAKDFALVHIASKLYNEFGERTTWSFTCSGTTTCFEGYDDIKRRGKPTELSRSPNDPRQGVLAISGTVTTVPGGIGDKYVEYFRNNVASENQLIDCDPYVSGTCDFKINANSKRIYIESIKCFGGGNGIKFGQYISKAGAGGLTNGVEISIQSEGNSFTFPLMKRTENWKNLFASTPGQNFRIDIQAGSDQWIAQFRPNQPIPIEPSGTVVGGDDFMQVKIQDDLSAGMTFQNCTAEGFEAEP